MTSTAIRTGIVLLNIGDNAIGTEQIAAPGALFGGPNNILADNAIEHLTHKVGEPVFLVPLLAHFC